MNTETRDYDNKSLSESIYQTSITHKPVETTLRTDERIIARITDGIYRQPASALRELISNAYDADATEVYILTDAPRFNQITIRDNGRGMSPEVLEHLIDHIGGSAKRAQDGKNLGITDQDNDKLSPGGRQLIGKLGIGLFSVAQFTRHFLIITKTRGDKFRTIVDIILGEFAGIEKPITTVKEHGEIERGHARIWREHAENEEAQGTEIILIDLLPRTRAELASDDLWTRIKYQNDDVDALKTSPPTYHIGYMKPRQSEVLEVPANLPWNENDPHDQRFTKLVQAIRRAADTVSEQVDLNKLCDRYLQTIWTLALAAPLAYVDQHPFDLVADNALFFLLENRPRSQAQELSLTDEQTPRQLLSLQSPNGTLGTPFDVFIDGVKLFRPITFKGLPKTSSAIQTPMLFIGQHEQRFEGRPQELSGGPLLFEAYLFCAPKIVPYQHQGVMLRVGNASGRLFDRTFMDYQVQDQQRLRRISAEIFVREGLDGAINIDRESFNYAHPHYQYIVKWLHSALRQLTNKNKELEKEARSAKLVAESSKIRAEVDASVEKALTERGVEDISEVRWLNRGSDVDAGDIRSTGVIALHKDMVLPTSNSTYSTDVMRQRQQNMEKKAAAIAQLLNGWGILSRLSYAEQETLIRNILEIATLDM